MNKFQEEEKVDVAAVCIEGLALNWYQWVDTRAPILSWSSFKLALVERFRHLHQGIAYEALVALKQLGTVTEFREQFEALSAPLREVGEVLLMGIFTNGLKEELRAELRLCRPKTLIELIEQAYCIEERNWVLEKIKPKFNRTHIAQTHNQTQKPDYFPWVSSNPDLNHSNGWNTATKNVEHLHGVRSQNRSWERGGTTPTKSDGFRWLTEADIQYKRERGLCFRCDEKFGPNHRCRNKSLQVLLMLEEEEDTEREEVTLEADDEPTSEDKTLKLRGLLGTEEVIVLVDSGASHNFISHDLVHRLGLSVEKGKAFEVMVGNGGADVVLGVAWLSTLGDVCANWKNLTMAFSREGRKVTLRGDPELVKTVVSLKAMLKSVQNTGAGYVVEFCYIESKNVNEAEQIDPEVSEDGSKPSNIRPYKYPYVQNNEIERLVGEMLIAGIIQPSTSPFSSSILLVKKKDGSWHFYVDYRALNSLTIPDKFPIPSIKELLDELAGATIFTILDLKSGYHQIRVREEDIAKIAFRTHEGHYEFLVMPFRLTNAPSTFQALMNTIFKPILRKFVLVFFDDILIYSPDSHSHLEHIRQVFQILKANELIVNRKKCLFAQQKLEYLGHLISAKWVEDDLQKIASMLSWLAPHTIKGLRGFLGLTGYYRCFVKGYGLIAQPLTQLLRKDSFTWDESAQKAFESLKTTMTTVPVLAMPDFDLPFEKSVYEWELMAIVFAVHKWSHYLIGRKFIIRTDQRSLKFLTDQGLKTPEQQKWISKLMEFSFEIHYQPGSSYQVTDALSRREEFSKFIPKLLKEFHDSPSGGHSGFFRTYKRVASLVFWEGIKRVVQEFVKRCTVCQLNKHSALKPAGLLQPLPIPTQVFEDISMHFIGGLPKSWGHDTVLIVVDRLTKYSHFIHLCHPYNAKEVATIFSSEIVRLHGFPKSIVSDRDRIFISQFWQELFKASGTMLKFSSAYHPQTDGQTEVVNRCVEAYLRCFCSAKPKHWSRWLSWAEFWYNTTYHGSTRMTPFKALYGKDPPTLLKFTDCPSVVEEVNQQMLKRNTILAEFKHNLSVAQGHMKESADVHCRDVTFQPGDHVFLKLQPYRFKSLATKHNEKLSPRFYGPFPIVECIGQVAYRLALPSTTRIHTVFHVSQLKGSLHNSVPIEPLPHGLTEDLELTVQPESVLAVRSLMDGTKEVLIRWQTLPLFDATWEAYDLINLQFPHFHLEDKPYSPNNTWNSSASNNDYTIATACVSLSQLHGNKLGDLWHQRLGHPHLAVLHKVVSQFNKPVTVSTSFCASCRFGKQCQTNFPSSIRKSLQPLELVNLDVWGPAPIASIEGYKYYVHFVDDYSNFTWIYPLKAKSETKLAFMEFHVMAERQFGTSLKCLQTNSGGEFQALFPYLKQHGILFRLSCSYMHQQNGKVERKHRHLVEIGLTLLAQAFMPLKYWWNAFQTLVFLINRLPTITLNHMSPFEVLFHQKPNYSFLKVFRLSAIITRSQIARCPSSAAALFAATCINPHEPSSVAEALASPHWFAAMTTKFDALQSNQTWILVPRSPDMHIVSNKWVFKIKYNADGSVQRCKTRLVAKGFQQQPGLDFAETFSPIVKPVTVCDSHLGYHSSLGYSAT
ncbi:uncharacterized protein LOC116115112 [Pistacia vera]|uniref:uncharacterized protein LOC116115112 n=1 Tax=Pistacia vera TaxID=55513 RepID=UPI0012634CEA|nr:uncharacterized protein LOC116115112 [Pistacia vera]